MNQEIISDSESDSSSTVYESRVSEDDEVTSTFVDRSRPNIKHPLPAGVQKVVNHGSRQRKTIADRTHKFLSSRSPGRENMPLALTTLNNDDNVPLNSSLISSDLEEEVRESLEANITMSRPKLKSSPKREDLSFLDGLPESDVDEPIQVYTKPDSIGECIGVKHRAEVSLTSTEYSLDTLGGGSDVRNVEDIVKVEEQQSGYENSERILLKDNAALEVMSIQSTDSLEVASVVSDKSENTSGSVLYSDSSDMSEINRRNIEEVEISSNTSRRQSAFQIYEVDDLDYSFDIGGLHSEKILADYGRTTNMSLYEDMKSPHKSSQFVNTFEEFHDFSDDDSHLLESKYLDESILEKSVLCENDDNNTSYTKTDEIIEKNKIVHTVKVKRQPSFDAEMIQKAQSTEDVDQLGTIALGIKCFSRKVENQNQSFGDSSCGFTELDDVRKYTYNTTDMTTNKEITTRMFLPFRETLDRGSPTPDDSSKQDLDLVKQQPRYTSSPLLSTQRKGLMIDSLLPAQSNQTLLGSGFDNDMDTLDTNRWDDTRSSWESNRTFTMTESDQSSSSVMDRPNMNSRTSKKQKKKMFDTSKSLMEISQKTPAPVALRVKRHSKAARNAKAKSWHSSTNPGKHPDEDCFFISYGKEEFIMVTPDGKTRSLREYSPDKYGDTSLTQSTPEITRIKDVVPDERRYPRFVRMNEPGRAGTELEEMNDTTLHERAPIKSSSKCNTKNININNNCCNVELSCNRRKKPIRTESVDAIGM